ncbi:MAG: RagB/SusD family nutrient uptake outer membrane protein [Tannerella sp.]|jgi:hypothetical protein|nr:RagB/SusD family nutrient uptake outer membrane protein [Tannerella sp.]
MKHIIQKTAISALMLLAGITSFFTSCIDDLLTQPDRVNLSDYYFWKTTADAEYALNGAIADIRGLFDRDYYFDGVGEYFRVRGNTLSSNKEVLMQGVAYRGFYNLNPTNFAGSFNKMYEYCYGGVNRANYVIDGVERMLEQEMSATMRASLEAVVGEARLLRSLVYFKLIALWGDVPYIDQRVYADAEVAALPRTPIAQIVPRLLDDLEYAYQKLPATASVQGRMAKPAALALRGKILLYWACWNHFGWPELDTFTPSEEEAVRAYTAAAADFRKVINDFGLTLFRNGEPGECDDLGKAEKLPNYYHLFLPTANGDPEFIIAFNHGGTGTNQGDELMRDFAGRSIEYSQCWVCPRFELADRYQSLTTGDFCDPLVGVPYNAPDATTRPNSALNPQSYANRDYRLKSTILWDFEKCMSIIGKVEAGFIVYKYGSWGIPVTVDGVNYTTYDTDGTNSGYVFRKFVRNYSNGQDRSNGNFNWPVIRLADVYLMYAEAVNAAGLAGEKADAIEAVNKVRRRANLPDLSTAKTATPDDFFAAIEQERIVELVAEGQRSFDLRRWRALERNFVQPYDPDGHAFRNVFGAVISTGAGEAARWFQYASQLSYERCYILQIPESERNRNPNLTQNRPFR